MGRNELAAGLLLLASAGWTGPPWWTETYPDGRSLTGVIFQEATKLVEGRVSRQEIAPLLDNDSRIFVERDGAVILVRDDRPDDPARVGGDSAALAVEPLQMDWFLGVRRVDVPIPRSGSLGSRVRKRCQSDPAVKWE